MQQSVLKLEHKHYPMYLNLELQATICKFPNIAEQPFIRSYHIQAKHMFSFQYMILSPAMCRN